MGQGFRCLVHLNHKNKFHQFLAHLKKFEIKFKRKKNDQKIPYRSTLKHRKYTKNLHNYSNHTCLGLIQLYQ